MNLAPPSQIFVPCSAEGHQVLDNGGDLIATCFTPQMATRVAELLNADAKAALDWPQPPTDPVDEPWIPAFRKIMTEVLKA